MNAPQATVGVPVYNGEKYLAQTLTALQHQELRDIEVLVADNASTDGSRAIAEKFAREDPRFRVLPSDVNRGSTWNYNRLVAEASAPFFMWNSADDVILPGHLATCRQLLLDHPAAVLALSRAVLIDEVGKQVGEYDDQDLDFLSGSPAGRLDLFLRRRVWYAAFGGLYRTAVLRGAGGYLPFWGQDIALAAKMALRAPWVQSNAQTYLWRFHDDQMSKLQGADPVQQTRVFRPDHRRPVAFPHWYLSYRILLEAVHAPIPTLERGRALLSIVRRWALPNWRAFAYDLKRNGVRLVKGRYVGPYHTA